MGCTAVHDTDCVPAKFSCTSVCTGASDSLVGSERQRQVPAVGVLHKVYSEMIWCLLACEKRFFKVLNSQIALKSRLSGGAESTIHLPSSC